METLQELHSILTDLGDERVLICADLNAHCRIWGYANEDTRGAQVEDFLLAHQLYLLNETNSPPTFEHCGRKGWPNLPFIKGMDFANSCTWKVLEDYTHSDHNYILIGALDKKPKHLVQQREENNTKDHLAKATEEFQKSIFAACRKAYKIKKFKLKINNNWWNQNLQIKKKELQALKRRTNKSEDDNKLKYQLQLSKKQAELKREAEKANRNSFRNTCTKTTDPYGWPCKAVVKNKHPPAELFKQLGNPSRGDTKSFALKIHQELHPPSHSPVTPPNFFPLFQEPQITKNEIRRILKKAPTKKAPGFDEPLKKGIIVLFHKDGKEADKIKSYIPVALLPTIGKVLEQILLRRLNHTLKKENILHHNQFGFRDGRSIDDAIHQLVEKMQDAKNKKLHTMVICLDIQGAFDHLQYNSIHNSLDQINFPSHTIETLKCILTDRKVTIQTAQGPVSWSQQQGCAQGSCTGPMFWNLVENEIISEEWQPNVHLQALADDFIFVISEPTGAKLKATAQAALTKFQHWTNKHQLKVSTEKSTTILISRLVSGPRVKWDNQIIKRSTSLKYQGLIIDKLN
ncbi:RNA-directed DNA polymerase from mobile element jockey [Araneus ventricosus]|uniref:RNA-directed DNA polymerase from mobile element jockey n=1 Tax=Araneus ventricosus TaxID=182803 RepID=A0A4Y2JFD9_ARAVE|nr:RNA-directed DNA polymerase from mobile element jockey [Araneus ventricosus]